MDGIDNDKNRLETRVALSKLSTDFPFNTVERFTAIYLCAYIFRKWHPIVDLIFIYCLF